jgi:hypothetical protein
MRFMAGPPREVCDDDYDCTFDTTPAVISRRQLIARTMPTLFPTIQEAEDSRAFTLQQ